MMKATKTWVFIFFLLIPAINLHAWPIPDTGETICYNNTAEIPCPASGEPFYGQDGNYTIDPPSYTKLDATGNTLADSTTSWTMVRDNVTGLIWENKTGDGSIRDGSKTFTWCDTNTATNGGNQGTCGTGTGNAATDTEAYIKALNDVHFGGFSDWRMPNVKELESIVDMGRTLPAVNPAWFPSTVLSYYWSYTSYPYFDSAWCVNFGWGNVGYNYKADAYAVRAVRGGQSGSLDHLVSNGDGTVTDTGTGLMWQQGAPQATMTWEAALTYAEGLSLAGYDDWRLPTLKELKSIVDYSHYGPAIDTALFPGTVSSYYWSSTTGAYFSGAYALCVVFSNGFVYSINKTSAYAGRAVRGGQSRLLGHLVISAPAQADRWHIGEQKAIAWDTAGISGNVRITLSRQGGKTGTFTETIADGVPNNGSYAWAVTGPASINCVLKIEPQSDTTKGTTQGLFSIMTSSGGTIDLPKTGQTKCYDASGAEISCTGTGQDGDIQAGMAWPNPRFTDKGDQTVLDNLTGLIWAKDGNVMKTRDPGFDADSTAGDGAVTWQHALDYIKKLNQENYLGHNDWRLPNVIELESLVHAGLSNSADWLISQGLSNIQANAYTREGNYWSSSTEANNTDRAWEVNIFFGSVGSINKSDYFSVWPVRSGQSGSSGSSIISLARTGQATCYSTSGGTIACAGTGQDGELQLGAAWPEVRFTDNGDQTVTDNLTGLIWTKDGKTPGPTACGPGGYKTWQGALDYVKCLNTNNYLGHHDWRFPNSKELRSLVYAGQSSPADWLNLQGFYNVQAYLYSSSTSVVMDYYAVSAWRVSMTNGDSGYFNKSLTTYVWPVRSEQSGTFASLVISKTGSGTVTSIPTGIACGNACSASFTTGTNVTLTATADNGAVFTGWTGSVCSGTSATCQVTMDDAKTVTATFTTADTTGPTGTVTINGGAAYTTNPAVTLTLSASDPSGVTEMKFSNDNATWSAAETYGTTKAWTLSSGDGSMTVYVKLKDSKGNWSGVVAATIALDTRAPVTTANPPAGTYNAAQNLTLAADETATIYYTTDGTTPTTASAVYSGPIAVGASQTFRFFARDAAGNTEAVKSVAYTIDTAAPTGGTIAIDGGAARTTSTAVTLTLAASDASGISQMQFSNDGTTWSAPETYNTTKSWTLSAGDGQKTVYVKFKDNAGNWSAPASTTITLGTTAPVTTANPKGGTFRNSQSVTLSASETATIYYTTNGDDPTTASPGYGDPISITADTTLKFFAKDAAGNAEAIKTERYVIDALPPTGTVTINSGATTTVTPNVTLTLAAADPSGVAQMQFSNDGATWSASTPYTTTALWTLTPGSGAKTVYARFADTVDNWTTTPITATITLQVAIRPQDPKGLAIEGVTASSVALQWNRNTEANVVYNIFRSRTADGIFYQVNTAPVDDRNYDYASGKMRFTDRIVKEGGSYYYKIQALLNGVASAGFSEIMGAQIPAVDDYAVKVIEPSAIVNISQTVKYILQLSQRDRFQGTVMLTCSKVSSGLSYAFVLNGQRSTVLSGVTLDNTVTLEITAGSLALAKEHHFELQVQNVWEGGSSDPRTIPLTLTVVAKNGAGIFADMDKAEFGKGEKVRIYGAILPKPLLEGKAVTLTITPTGGGNTWIMTVKTNTSGKFYEAEWLSALGLGSYVLQASWQDENTDTWTSVARPFTVGRGEAVVTCQRDGTVKPKQGEQFTISGKLNPAFETAVTRRLVDPDGVITDQRLVTAEDGSYSETDNFFTKKGVWKFKVYWTGNDDWIGTESEWLSVPVEVELGRAIILGGGVAEQANTYWEVTKKLSVDAYRDFKSRGFTDDMINLMINGQLDINYDSKIDDVVDNGQPSVTAFLDAIRSRYALELDTEIPLYIYMQGHGTNDARFKVLGDDQYVNAAQIKGALDTLQQQTGCTVVLIIEACYSGTFIQGLASPEGYKRIILTSADNEPYNTDASGRNAFSRYLFSKLREGDNFYKAFTYTRNVLQNMGYPPPRLEDFSGGVLATAMLLKGDLTWGLRPVIAAIEAPSVLESATTMPIAVNVTRGDVDVEKVWLQVIAPNAKIIGQEGTIAYPEVGLVKNAATGKYIGTLNGLSISGTYKIVVFAQDVDKEVSDPATAFITVASPPMPGDVNGDEYVTLADAILAMQMATRTVPPAEAIQEGYTPSIGDVNADGKIGLAETIYILQKVAGMR